MKTVQPYELLVRYKDGVFSGAAVRTLTKITDDQTGEVYAVREDVPQALDVVTLTQYLDRAKTDGQAFFAKQAAQAAADAAVTVSPDPAVG